MMKKKKPKKNPYNRKPISYPTEFRLNINLNNLEESCAHKCVSRYILLYLAFWKRLFNGIQPDIEKYIMYWATLSVSLSFLSFFVIFCHFFVFFLSFFVIFCHLQFLIRSFIITMDWDLTVDLRDGYGLSSSFHLLFKFLSRITSRLSGSLRMSLVDFIALCSGF